MDSQVSDNPLCADLASPSYVRRTLELSCEISALGAQVIGISNDGPFANKAFAEKFHFNYPILGDYKSKTIRDYDILMPDLLHVKGNDAAKRSVFVVDENGSITYKWVSESPLVEPNYQEIIDSLKK